MASLKGSRTEKNLLTAFAGESQARNRYTFFASQAKKEGFEHVSAIFEETANHEKAHAKRLFQFLEGGKVEVRAEFPAGVIGSTLDNLKAAAAGEHEEHACMYPEFAGVAREEGFTEIAVVIDNIIKAEQYHERRYLALARAIETGEIFKRCQPETWVCRNCGYVHTGTEPPAMCPACAHPKAHFEVRREA